MMNRQIRRAQEKQDKKEEKEKERRREARREKLDQARARRTRRREEAKRARAEGGSAGVSAGGGGGEEPAKPGRRGRKPGRFAGALMMATVFFIVLQSAAPPEEAAGNELLRSITGAGFYLLFGYFSVLWLMRRGTPRPVMMTLISGAFLTIGVEVAKMLQPEVVTDPLMLALAIPGLVGGAFLGRLVYVNSPG